MKFFHSHFQINIDTDDFTLLFNKINSQYDRIPATKCLFCPSNKSVVATCCKVYHPPMFLAEFLQILLIIVNWSDDRRKQLLIKCFESYLNPELAKPCVLLDGYLCSVYKARPTSCRLYSQYSSKSWSDRLKNVKNILGIEDKSLLPMNGEQCQNIEFTGNQKRLSRGDEDEIFARIQAQDVKLFHDKKIGLDLVYSSATYLPFDAHYLLISTGPDNLETLTDIRTKLDNARKDFAKEYISKEELDKVEESVKDFLVNIISSMDTQSSRQK